MIFHNAYPVHQINFWLIIVGIMGFFGADYSNTWCWVSMMLFPPKLAGTFSSEIQLLMQISMGTSMCGTQYERFWYLYSSVCLSRSWNSNCSNPWAVMERNPWAVMERNHGRLWKGICRFFLIPYKICCFFVYRIKGLVEQVWCSVHVIQIIFNYFVITLLLCLDS